MSKDMNIICAVEENLGIGKNSGVPWNLPLEYAHFRQLATFRKDKSKKNAAIIGRKTFMDEPHEPDDAICYIVVSKTLNEPPGCAAYVCKTVPEAYRLVSSRPLADMIENIWIWGGGGVYKEAMSMEECKHIYLTRVYGKFECDAFFPGIDSNHYRLTRSPNITKEIQEENGLKYKFELYERYTADSTKNKDE